MIRYKRFRCLESSNTGLTKNKIYLVSAHPVKRNMYSIKYYDGETEPGPLNDFWARNFFEELPSLKLNKQIKIL